MAGAWKVALGTASFVVFWILATFPTCSLAPIGRTAGALLSATLMVATRVLSPSDAFQAVDLHILTLLFSTMLLAAYLQRANLFQYLRAMLSWRSLGGRDLLVRVCLLAGASSALLTNDTACITFTSFLLDICRLRGLPPEPFLLALATSANIGSAATPIGNPQNIVIALQGNIEFGTFFLGVLPSMALGLLVNTLGLLALYWKQLEAKKNDDGQAGITSVEISVRKESERVCLDGMETANGFESSEESIRSQSEAGAGSLTATKRNGKETAVSKSMDAMDWLLTEPRSALSSVSDENGNNSEISACEPTKGINDERGNGMEFVTCNEDQSSSNGILEASEARIQASTFPVHPEDDVASSGRPYQADSGSRVDRDRLTSRWSVRALRIPRRPYLAAAVYLVTVGMLGGFVAGLDLAWVATGAAVILVVLDRIDAGPMLAKVSYSLLVFFSGMFISVEGFNATGLPEKLWNAVEPHARVNTPAGVAIFSCVVTLLSNVASNVPTVLLLGPRVASSAASVPGVSVTRAWLLLAWISTVAGNLTLVGSAATLIVCEEARFAPIPYHLTFWRHLRYGLPSTVVIIALGVLVVRG